MTGTLASFAAMAVAGRELTRELGTFQILFFRSLIGLAVLALLLSRHGWGQVRTRRLGRHVVRNVAHYGGQFGWFYGLAALPMATVFAIEFTTPIWTLFVAIPLLGERLTPARILAVALGVAGVLVILRPGIAPISLPALAVLAGAVGYALMHTLTKDLVRTETPLCVLFYMTLVQLPLGLLPSLAHWVKPAPQLWPWLVVVALTALSAHYCLSRAFALADAMVVVPLDFLRLPLIALIGFLFYAEPLELFVLGGAVLMLAGNLVNLRAERHKAVP